MGISIYRTTQIGWIRLICSGGGIVANDLKARKAEIPEQHLNCVLGMDRQRVIYFNTFPAYVVLNPSLQIGEQNLLRMSVHKQCCLSQLRLATDRSMYLNVGGVCVYVESTQLCPL